MTWVYAGSAQLLIPKETENSFYQHFIMLEITYKLLILSVTILVTVVSLMLKC